MTREGKVEFKSQIRSTINDVIIIELPLELISIYTYLILASQKAEKGV